MKRAGALATSARVSSATGQARHILDPEEPDRSALDGHGNPGVTAVDSRAALSAWPCGAHAW